MFPFFSILLNLHGLFLFEFELQVVKIIFQQLKKGISVLILNDLDDERINFYKSLRKLLLTHPAIVSKDLLCPITNEIFFEPVLTCDGQSYEKKAIEQWLLKFNTSIITFTSLI